MGEARRKSLSDDEAPAKLIKAQPRSLERRSSLKRLGQRLKVTISLRKGLEQERLEKKTRRLTEEAAHLAATQEGTLLELGVPVAVHDNILNELHKMKSWTDFNIFDLKKMVPDGSTMPLITQYALQSFGMTDKLGVSAQDLCKVLKLWDAGYYDNPYHNRDHAGDVTQGAYYLTISSGLQDIYVQCCRSA